MMTLMTAYSELAIAWRERNPDNHASEEVADRIRHALKGMHSDNTMSDGDEVHAVERALAFFEDMLKPKLFKDYSPNKNEKDNGRIEPEYK
ncbi:MAG: hypothetical protein DI604_20435 [Delftia acidovorans]|nr:MAG: hypothetical protein DI604_20435 [Delftia acidovorans]